MLDFPELIDVQEQSLVVALANSKANKTTALAAMDLQAFALSRFGDWKPRAAALVAKYQGVAFDCATVKGLQAATDARAEVREPRYAAQRVSKASKSELARVSKAIGTEEQAIIDALAATEEHIDAQIRADAERRATEQAERDRIEAERIAKHEAGIVKIRGYVGMAQGLPSPAIARGIAVVEGLTFGPEWDEFAVPAANAQCEVLESLRTLLASTTAAEESAAELVRVRAEQARIAEEQRTEARRLAEVAEIARREREAEQAEIAALRKQLADERAALDAAEAKRKADEQDARDAEDFKRRAIWLDEQKAIAAMNLPAAVPQEASAEPANAQPEALEPVADAVAPVAETQAPAAVLAGEAKGTATDKDKYIRELENEHSAKLATAVAALELIAVPMRPDGTWNRDRAACQMLAQLTLGVFEAERCR